MKFSQLSNFQKQQYTNYLETQLQKFSAFMLAQRRENEKYRLLEDAIAYQTDLIQQVQAKLQLAQLHQRQNHDACEHLSKKISRIDHLDDRLRRLEDRQRFGCDEPSSTKERNRRERPQFEDGSEETFNRLACIDQNYKECMKFIKKQQSEITDCQDALDKIQRRRHLESAQTLANPENAVEKKDLKRLEKKMVKYIDERIQQMEASSHRRKSKSRKSPSGQTNELSIIDNYTIKDSKKAITSFRIDDQIPNKSEISTILQSKSTKNSKASDRSQRNHKKRRETSKSKSKSKDKGGSKSKSRKQRKSKSRSKSRTKKSVDKSFSLTDESIIRSSKSRSKSRTPTHQKSKSKDSKLSKLSKKSRKNHSRQKSHSNSHDLCKKRPQLMLNLPKRVPQIKRESVPLRKRQGMGVQRYK